MPEENMDEQDDGIDCCICLMNLHNSESLSSACHVCKYVFHMRCLQKVLITCKRECPLCRSVWI